MSAEYARVGYLGPEGSFTHIAAGRFAQDELVALPHLNAVFTAVAEGTVDYGVAAIENNVEGFVGETLDLLRTNPDVKITDMVWLPIGFNAVGVAGASVNQSDAPRIIRAHPHALAQCREFIEAHSLTPMPALSNSAAVQGLAAGELALSPAGYALDGERYATFAKGVQDFDSAKTQFVLVGKVWAADDVLDPRVKPEDDRGDEGEFSGLPRAAFADARNDGGKPNHQIYIITPNTEAPGTLLKVLQVLASADINISTLVSRPIKGEDALYSFYLTLDANLATAETAVKEIEALGNQVQHLGGYCG